MTPDRFNFLLKSAAAVMAIATPLVAAAGLMLSLDSPEGADRPRRVTTRPAGVAPAAVASAGSFGEALSRPLRPSLNAAADPPVAQPPAASPAAGIDRLTLVGTVGNSIAMIKGPDGRVALVEVGDDIEGAAVVTISDRLVELRQGKRVVRLEKPQPPAGGDLTVR